jgi:hypothetical protein
MNVFGYLKKNGEKTWKTCIFQQKITNLVKPKKRKIEH